MAQIINQNEFEAKVLQADKPVLVDFYADWCGPCKMMIPVLDQLSAEKADQIQIYKINVDENPELASQFQVMSIPSLFVMKNGKIVNQSMGARPKNQILAMVK